jgi:hypothetical protein
MILFASAIQNLRGNFVKATARRVDIGKWKVPRVRAIGEKNKNAPRFRFNPQTRSRKTKMSETVFR